MNRLSTWVVVAAAAIIAVIFARAYFTGGAASGTQGPGSLGGRQAPHVVLHDGGKKIDLLALAHGKTVILNLWATWCPPCRAEMPDLQRLYRANRNRGLLIYGIDQGESMATASAFARSLGVGYPLISDKDQQYGRVYGALGLPTTILVDPAGTIVHAYDGPLTYGQMEAAVTPLLSAAKPAGR